MIWNVEDIADDQRLFLRVHQDRVRGSHGKLIGTVFVQKGPDGMSVDWEKYSSSEQSRDRAPNPDKNGIVTLISGQVREIENLTVKHKPMDNNQGHSLVIGLEDPPLGKKLKIHKVHIRRELIKKFNQWTIKPKLFQDESI